MRKLATTQGNVESKQPGSVGESAGKQYQRRSVWISGREDGSDGELLGLRVSPRRRV